MSKTSWHHLKGPKQLKQLAATIETGESQQSKQKQKKTKIRIYSAIFLIQCFCWHSILPFSKSCWEIESTQSIEKCRWRKSVDTRYYIVGLCDVLRFVQGFVEDFHQNQKQLKFFQKYTLILKVYDQSKQATKKLFCHMMIRNYLYSTFCIFVIKAESTLRHEITEQTLLLT